MNKVISFPQINRGFLWFYNNTLKSFNNALIFLIKECRPPTLLIKIPYALINPEINFQTKQKLCVGIALLTTFSQMASKLVLHFNQQTFTRMLNVNSLMVNTFFTSLVLESMLSKVKTIISHSEDLPFSKQRQLNQILGTHFVAELLMLSTTAVGVFSFLNLIGYNENNERISTNMGLIKTSCFILGHIIMSGQNYFQPDWVKPFEPLVSNNIKSLWYDIVDNKYQFLTEYRSAALVSNIIFLIYSVATTLQNCDGPPGPNGDRSCLNDSVIEKSLYFIQMMCNLWVAESFMRKAIDQITAIKSFDEWLNPTNYSIFKYCRNQSSNPNRIIPVQMDHQGEEMKDAFGDEKA
ncbi:MAG: hypothetical protein VW397_05875 [Candidatus Margulisiibacteriota bacterium]